MKVFLLEFTPEVKEEVGRTGQEMHFDADADNAREYAEGIGKRILREIDLPDQIQLGDIICDVRGIIEGILQLSLAMRENEIESAISEVMLQVWKDGKAAASEAN